MSRPRIAGFITIVVGVCIALAGCSSSPARGYRQGPVPGVVYYRDSDHTLHVLSCGSEFRMTESANQITIVSAQWAYTRGTGSCRVFDFTLLLQAPLGGRRVVDGTTDRAIPVMEWGQNRITAPETPAPSLSPMASSRAGAGRLPVITGTCADAASPTPSPSGPTGPPAAAGEADAEDGHPASTNRCTSTATS